jgi:hypothetical protein
MRPTWSVFALSLAALTLASPSGAQAPATSVRFRDPGSITGDPTGLRQIVPFRGPRYPQRALGADETAAPVVAFVVDTTGRVELTTASFLNYVAPDFQLAVCEMLPALRFEPLAIAGQKMRVLFVQFYGFNSLTQPDEEGLMVSRALMRERQEAYATQPVENVIPELERRPHCDNLKGK